MKSHPTEEKSQWPPEMMTPEQRKTVTRAYNHLMEREARGWDGLDDYIDYLEYLDDDQLHREADAIYAEHAKGKVRCLQEHPIENCFIPMLVDAAGAIIELYKETNSMHAKNKYIIQYYLAMQQAGIILYDPA
jgi:hypothetical protein